MQLESIISELRGLSSKKPLRSENQARAKHLMIELRKQGFTNKEISDLEDGTWSEPTVKLYTSGTAVENSSVKKDTIDQLKELVNRNLSLDDVSSFLSVEGDLRAKGVSIEDVSSMLVESMNEGVSIKDLSLTHKDMTEHDLSSAELKETLSYRKEIESRGGTREILKGILESAERYGDCPKVLDGINEYGSIQQIRSNIDDLNLEQQKKERQIKGLEENIGKLEEKKSFAEGTIKLYKSIRSKGYTEENLKALTESSEKYGGVDEVLDVVNSCIDASKFKVEIEDLKRKKADEESELKRVKAEHAHFQAIINICDLLLNKLKFSVPAIEQIYKTAKLHGNPLEVIKAIGNYGDKKAIERKIEDLSATERDLKARIKELKSQLSELRGTLDEMNSSVRNLFLPFAEEIKNSIVTLQQKFAESIDAISRKQEEYGERYAELTAATARLEEELKLAKVLMAMIHYPSETKDLPLDYDVMMLNGILQHCSAKGINNKVEPTDAVRKKYRFAIDTELTDLIQWTLKGLKECSIGTEGIKRDQVVI